MARRTADDGRRWFVLVGGINDEITYTTGAAKTEVRNLLRNRPHLEGRIDVVPVPAA